MGELRGEGRAINAAAVRAAPCRDGGRGGRGPGGRRAVRAAPRRRCGAAVLQAMSGREEEEWQALKPREPSPSQCCGGGCQPCVYDVYEKELERWERARAARDKNLLVEKQGEVSTASWHPQAGLRAVPCNGGALRSELCRVTESWHPRRPRVPCLR